MKMGRRPASPESSLDLMCEEFTRSGWRSPRSVRAYREACTTVIRDLRKSGRNAEPWKITEEDIRFLLDLWTNRGLTVASRRHYITMTNTWMQYYGNTTLRDMRIRWPTDMRPNTDWITEGQARQLLALDMTPTQELVVHCELCLGMRRIEVLRLKVGSFKGSFVEIIGKGSMGGKPRIMPYHRDTSRILDRYMRFRDSIIDIAKGRRANTVVPDALLIYMRGYTLKAYSVNGVGIDSMLKKLGKRIDVDFSNHTLRRTFGRTMYRSGVPPATISKMMGHESIDQTLKYIGVDLDDMMGAMTAFTL